MDDKQVVGLTRGFANRVSRTVRTVEAQPVNSAPGGRNGTPWTYGIVRARITTAVTTGSWTSPSSAGRAQIRHKDASGAWVDSGDPVVVWNDNTLASSLPVNRVVKLAWIDGEYWLTSSSCA